MASQFISAVKYGMLAVAAFVGPKMITESGNYLHNIEQESGRSTVINPVNQKSEVGKLYVNNVNNKNFYENKEGVQYRQGGEDWDKKFFHSFPSRVEDEKSFLGYERSREIHREEEGKMFKNERYRVSRPFDLNRRLPITPLEEILLFDKTPDWILARWKIADTVRSSYPLLGYRVEIITGSKNDDLTGVLTYFFDEYCLQRIEFLGITGDFIKIREYLVRRYGMKLTGNSNATLYQYKSSFTLSYFGSDRKTSILEITPSLDSVYYEQKSKYDIKFVLYRPE